MMQKSIASRISGVITYCLLCLGILLPKVVTAVPNDNIKVINMLNGLADNTVWSIHKDSDQYVWFGTDNGLCRYDGQHFTNFADPHRFCRIQYLVEPSSRVLWFVSDGAFSAFNRQQERFLPLHWDEDTSPFDNINCLIAQNDSTAWVVHRGALHRVVLGGIYENEVLIAYQAHITHTYHSFAGETDKVIKCCFGPQGEMAVVTRGGHLVMGPISDLATPEKLTTVTWFHLPFKAINSLSLIDDTFWMGTSTYGAFSYHIPSGKIQNFAFSEGPSSPLPHTDVYAITPLPHNNGLFLATWSGYTWLHPLAEGGYKPQIFDISTDDKLKGYELRMISALCDAEGNVWAGTRGGGVLQFSFKAPFYNQLFQQVHNVFCALETDNQGYLWAATFHHGIMRSESAYKQQEHLAFKEVYSMPKGKICYAVTKGVDGNLWFGYSGGILQHINPKTLASDSFIIDSSLLPDIWALYWDSAGHLLACTNKGLYAVDPITHAYQCLLSGFHVFSLVIASDNTYWLGTQQGLVHLDPATGRVQTGYDPSSTSYHSIRSLFFSKQGDLYIGYENGLGLIPKGADTLSAFYTTREGLCSNFIGCITQDTKGHIWIGSNSGITCFNKELQFFQNLYISGNYRSVLSLDNQLIWGTNKDIIALHPLSESLTGSQHKRTYITQLEINNEPVVINEEKIGQGIVLKPRNFRFSIILNNFSYESDFQKFRYRLFPYEKEWRLAEDNERISYARLPHGKYVLEAYTMGPDGTSGPITTFHVTILPKWTQTVWFTIGCFLVFVFLILFSHHRITKAQRRREQEILLKQEMQRMTQEKIQAEQLHQERIHFFTQISHELRTPLSLIVAPVKEILDASSAPNMGWKNKLQLVEKNATLLSTTVDQMLYLQKMEAGMVQSHFQPTDLADVTRQVTASFGDLARIKHLMLTCHFPDEPVMANADSEQITSAIRNVLSNALKYTPDGGTVHISLEKVTHMDVLCGRISIADNGPGISKVHLEHLFDAFTTTPNQPTVSNKMGIGLKTVKSILNQHHGMVDVITEEGHGCTFILSIPLLLTTPSTPSTPTPENTTPCPPTKKMLIVEDNADMQDYLRGLFSPTFSIYQAFNGEEGIEEALAHLPDIILCDVMMPVMDGFSCCLTIRQNPRTSHIPFVMLTARTADADMLQGLQFGADDYVLKPFNPTLLQAKVQGLIHQRASLEQCYRRTLFKQDETLSESPFMRQVIHYIEQHLAYSELGIGDIANTLHVTPQTLARKLKKETSLTPAEFIRGVRMSKAASLLMTQHYAVKEVADRVGYNDLATFRSHFKKRFGVVPSQFCGDASSGSTCEKS